MGKACYTKYRKINLGAVVLGIVYAIYSDITVTFVYFICF